MHLLRLQVFRENLSQKARFLDGIGQPQTPTMLKIIEVKKLGWFGFTKTHIQGLKPEKASYPKMTLKVEA